MTTFFDTSAVIPLTDDTHEAHLWCRGRYEAAAVDNPPIVMSDMVYCEVSMGMDSKEATDEALAKLFIERVGYSDEALFKAGRAFLRYKRNGGASGNVLPDFLIGALAEADGSPIVTRDDKKIRTYFPGVARIHPSTHPLGS